MKPKSIFEFSSYKSVMRHTLRQAGLRGTMSRAAEALNCQRSYLSRVIDSEIHLTPDQAFLLGKFLKWSTSERDYFTTMVEHERASDKSYREHVQIKLNEMRRAHESLTERMKRPPPRTIERQEASYFSRWQMSAIHFLTASPNFQTPETLAERLGLARSSVLVFLEQLASWGMVQHEGSRWKYLSGTFHLPKESPLVIQHHHNWRDRAILDAQLASDESLHYTNIQTVSGADIRVLKELMLNFISSCKEVLDPSQEEDVVAITCDLFRV